MSDLSPSEIRMRCIEAAIRLNLTAGEMVESAALFAAYVTGAEPAPKPERDREAARAAIDAGAENRMRMRVARAVPETQFGRLLGGHDFAETD